MSYLSRDASVSSGHLDAIFAALADPTRRAILDRLAQGEASVNELLEPFNMSQPAVSKHLRVLREAGVVQMTKMGKTVECSLDKDFHQEMGKPGSTLDFGCCTFRFTENVPLKIRKK